MRKQISISTEHKELLLKIGMILKDMRQSQKIKTIQLAKQVDIHRNTYYLMELGKIDFQFTTLVRILDNYGITVAEFFQKL